MKAKSQSLFEESRLHLKDSIELSLESLREYGRRYRHWATAYSGGKDSSATVTFIAWAIREGHVPAPETWTVLLSDTRQELPPLISAAMRLMDHLRRDGIDARVVMPPMDDRFYVYMLGRGVPPPKNRFRWCTPQLKIMPMQFALEDEAAKRGMGTVVNDGDAFVDWETGNIKYYKSKNRYGRQYVGNGKDKMLMLTGVRMGESAARDQRIAISCKKDSGECGQGWFQTATPEALADTLAPLLHWRLCHVFDWLYFETKKHGYPEVIDIAEVYGDDDVRTGCIGCNLVDKDTALLRLLSHHPDSWGHLSPLLELKPLFRELQKARYRKRKSEPEINKDGSYAKNGQRLGPLTMEARAWGLDAVLNIQQRVNAAANGREGISLINEEEEARIRELWALGTWPNGWDGDEIVGDVPLDSIMVTDSGLVVQPLLMRGGL